MTTLPRTYDEVKSAVETSSSIRELLTTLGYAISGPNSKHVQRMMRAYNLELPARTPGRRGVQVKIEDLLVADIQVSGKGLKNRLIKEALITYRCTVCDNDGTWNGKPLTLQLDHINGNNRDNRLENLRLLCPNCHVQTETWGRKKRN